MKRLSSRRPPLVDPWSFRAKRKNRSMVHRLTRRRLKEELRQGDGE